MNLHELKPSRGSVKNNKRKGRGQGSGQGGTATRGHKGQKSRSGYGRKRNHEGGQTPIQMRVPKRGFNSPFKKVYVPINLVDLQRLTEKHNVDTIDYEFLRTHKLLRKSDKVKVLGNGKLEAALTVEAHAISASAKEAIESAGGTIKIV